jgi:citrate synthase
MAESPSRGLADVVAAATALSDIDGKAGLLFYRGYDIHELAGDASFEEIAFLLQRGHAPDRGELDGYRAELTAGRHPGALASSDLPGIASHQRPMEALRSLVSLGSADDPDAGSNEPAANLRKAARLTAQLPTTRRATAGKSRPSIPASARLPTSCSS